MDDDKNMYSEVKVELFFSGFAEDPNEVSKLLGIEATRIKRKGELTDIPFLKPTKLRHTENVWVYKVTDDISIDMVSQIDDLMFKLLPYLDKLENFSKTNSPVLNVVIKSYGGDRPLIWYKREAVEFLNAINTETGIDLYVFD